MAVALGIHLLDILKEVHAVFPSIIEPANERRDIGRFLCALCRSVDRRRLLLGKTEGNVDAHPMLYRSLCSTQTFMCAWVFNVSIRNPGEHILALRKHLLGACLEIGEHFDRYTCLSHQRRDCLDDLFVFLRLLFQTQFMTRCYLRLDDRILGNQTRIGCLAVDESYQGL
jgi:hypothetical protein